MQFDYLIEGVSPKEYETLNGMKEGIVENTIQGFNDFWRNKVKGIKVSFKYNEKESVIGITIRKGKEERLALERKGLNEKENAVVAGLHYNLQEELKRIRIKEGTWT